MTGSAPLRWTLRLQPYFYRGGEESEERGWLGIGGSREGWREGWRIFVFLNVVAFLLLFTVFWAPRPENENAKLNYFRT